MPRSVPNNLIIICDGCGTPCPLQLTADNSDPAKGFLVNEAHYGKCEKCDYTFLVKVQMFDKTYEEDKDQAK